MVDSHLPRFTQALLALLLLTGFLLGWRWIAPILMVALLLALVGGPTYNPFAQLYRRLPIPRGEPEPAAPPRFSQALGVGFLALGTVVLYAVERETVVWWALGWGPVLAVAVLAAVAATTSF